MLKKGLKPMINREEICRLKIWYISSPKWDYKWELHFSMQIELVFMKVLLKINVHKKSKCHPLKFFSILLKSTLIHACISMYHFFGACIWANTSARVLSYPTVWAVQCFQSIKANKHHQQQLRVEIKERQQKSLASMCETCTNISYWKCGDWRR